MPSQITPGFGQSDYVDVHVEIDVMILYVCQHICMNQLSQTYYSSKHVIYWFAAIMIKYLGPNAHLEPLVLAHIYFF